MLTGIKGVLSILAIGIVVWWFVRPESNGPKMIGGLIGDALAYMKILMGQPVAGA